MQRQAFNDGWVFYKGGEKDGMPVTLPHDAAQTERRSPDAAAGPSGAYYPANTYRYVRELDVPASWESRHVLLEFEGAYRKARVLVNRVEAGSCAYGYLPFTVSLDGLLRYGEKNRIEVVCDCSQRPDSRWYTGAGIYRTVWLWLGPEGGPAIEPWDVRVTTLSTLPACVSVGLAGAGADACAAMADGSSPMVEILDGDDVVACTTELPCTVEVPDARLWSDEDPHLYTCRVTLGAETATTRFGIRTLGWAAGGLFVNGKKTLLRGGCVHHDSGILGAATFDEFERRRIARLKEAGFNAIRSAHNPLSRAALEACDELGVYVMDEAWDMWYQHKSVYDYASDFMDNWRGDLASIVARDYNHPAVVMYSIGNEVSEPAEERGVEQARAMVSYLHELDATRPVTAGINLAILGGAAMGMNTYEEGGGRNDSADAGMNGMNSLVFNVIASKVGTAMNNVANLPMVDRAVSPVLDSLDIAGYNYASGRYKLEGHAHPGRVVVGSETFPQDIARNWAAVERYPYLIGDFMWAAWDYIGEAGSGGWTYDDAEKGFEKPWPWFLADNGAFDILGDPTGDLFWAQAVWHAVDAPIISVQPPNHPGVEPGKATWRGTNSRPSWSWDGCDGNLAWVEVYFDCAHVELLLNGRLVARRRARDCRARILCPYEPGTLEAVAYDADDNEIARSPLTSAGEKSVWVAAEVDEAAPGQLVLLPCWIGSKDVVESNADEELTVTVKGGELVAFGSANPRTEEHFQDGRYTTYYGRAMAAVRAGAGDVLRVTVTGERGGSCTCEVPIRE